jgi:hypothetical protein
MNFTFDLRNHNLFVGPSATDAVPSFKYTADNKIALREFLDVVVPPVNINIKVSFLLLSFFGVTTLKKGDSIR